MAGPFAAARFSGGGIKLGRIRHTKGTRLKFRYDHLVPKRGKKRAVIAIAHQLLTLIHTLLSERVPYDDPGWKPALTPKHRTRRAYYHLRCLQRLGYRPPVSPAVPAAGGNLSVQPSVPFLRIKPKKARL